ncbi:MULTISPECIES: hypothetical protein [unclassified Streptomyces]|uniref:hypothetical protein n=1 Tax=unclassified Streptomyces TaxID=2593676 RepID=UPI002DDAFB07|nr:MULTISPECIES: hypothetical protein [unclassified Streptomyces]WSA90371.1 hypothetical protein OIE63_01625 [Streptomyces sp. NBC_01795]WSB74597.1 hypothetical protein OHB04_01620 [Streptomyces sp. NBC_01775]WSS17017.1 hypothetical protein OG533_37780 [Streptomyces sp. NBC_01186]WSS45761.1 hypothetical protein OG220_38030 [Streptomyces sp. NBC_01187]
MTEPTAQETDSGTEAAAEDVLYSAEVCCTEGRYTLTVTDHATGTEHSYPVAKKMVDKLPFYLSMLRSKLS